MRVRAATSDDAAAIAALHADSWRATYRGAYRDEYLDGDVLGERMSVWAARLSVPPAKQFVAVAVDEERLVGFACVYGGDDARWGSLLDNLHVRRELHRRGAGRRLLAAVAAWCAANHPECGLYLWVLEQNTGAQRFYERLGATDRGGGVSTPPGGGQVQSRRYAWDTLADVRTHDPRGAA